MPFGWFDTQEVDALADELVARLRERFPPQDAAPAGGKAFDRMRRLFGATFQRIDAFAQGRRLNVYQKARFANRMRWALLEAGYARDFVDAMTQELVTHLTLAARARR